jgi:hypothetical protein
VEPSLHRGKLAHRAHPSGESRASANALVTDEASRVVVTAAMAAAVWA